MIGGTLWQPGVDSNNPDEAWTQTKAGTWRTVDGERVQTKLIDGNVFKLEAGEDGTPVWRKFRNVPGGEHVHDLAEFDGAIYAVGSGADHRFEFEEQEGLPVPLAKRRRRADLRHGGSDRGP